MVLDTIATSALIIGGAWTLYHFFITRARHPKLEIDLEFKTLGKSGSNYIVELAALITNKGLTRQHIHNFTFNVLTYGDGMEFKTNAELRYQLYFKKRLVDMQWVKPDHRQFVDAGITRRFTHVTVLPADTRYVMVYSKFHNIYKDYTPPSEEKELDVSLEPPSEVLVAYKPDAKVKGQKHHRYHVCRTFALIDIDRASIQSPSPTTSKSIENSSHSGQ
jgi:hypothetical protein